MQGPAPAGGRAPGEAAAVAAPRPLREDDVARSPRRASASRGAAAAADRVETRRRGRDVDETADRDRRAPFRYHPECAFVAFRRFARASRVVESLDDIDEGLDTLPPDCVKQIEALVEEAGTGHVRTEAASKSPSLPGEARSRAGRCSVAPRASPFRADDAGERTRATSKGSRRYVARTRGRRVLPAERRTSRPSRALPTPQHA